MSGWGFLNQYCKLLLPNKDLQQYTIYYKKDKNIDDIIVKRYNLTVSIDCIGM